jgi:hypothetical protein
MFILFLGKIKFYHVKVAEKISTIQSSVHNNDNDLKMNIYDQNDNNNNNMKNHGRSSSKRKNKPKNMVES